MEEKSLAGIIVFLLTILRILSSKGHGNFIFFFFLAEDTLRVTENSS